MIFSRKKQAVRWDVREPLVHLETRHERIWIARAASRMMTVIAMNASCRHQTPWCWGLAEGAQQPGELIVQVAFTPADVESEVLTPPQRRPSESASFFVTETTSRAISGRVR
ncbi:hypothetical protein [Reticulibacter mediterranei]|uniref:hypothetical protein n=1 Tax=Reticulibacter mediterranei TaxID=2778369 RepID=UPI001C68E858|nr:hypothetical protein [Reticulibacter mediterranei]